MISDIIYDYLKLKSALLNKMAEDYIKTAVLGETLIGGPSPARIRRWQKYKLLQEYPGAAFITRRAAKQTKPHHMREYIKLLKRTSAPIFIETPKGFRQIKEAIPRGLIEQVVRGIRI